VLRRKQSGTVHLQAILRVVGNCEKQLLNTNKGRMGIFIQVGKNHHFELFLINYNAEIVELQFIIVNYKLENAK
jgi:hypothetical protein